MQRFYTTQIYCDGNRYNPTCGPVAEMFRVARTADSKSLTGSSGWATPETLPAAAPPPTSILFDSVVAPPGKIGGWRGGSRDVSK